MIIYDSVNEETIDTEQAVETMWKSFYAISRITLDLKINGLLTDSNVISKINNILNETSYTLYDLEQNVKENVRIIQANYKNI